MTILDSGYFFGPPCIRGGVDLSLFWP